MDNIKKQLIKHKLNPKNKGFIYLCFILMSLKDIKIMPCLKIEVYPKAALQFNTSVAAVEKAVSGSINASLKKMSPHELFCSYGAIYNDNTVKLTNKCFIAHILNKISLDYYA